MSIKQISGRLHQKYNTDLLVYYEMYEDIIDALTREKQIKKWSRHKKNILVNLKNPEWKDLYTDLH